MKSRLQKLWILLPMIILVTALMMSGCSKKSKSETAYDNSTSSMDTRAIAPAEAAEESSIEQSVAEDSASGISSVQGSTMDKSISEGRKLIKNVNLNVETKAFDDFTRDISTEVGTLGGYIENSEVSGNSYNSDNNRYATIVARIPSDSLNSFMRQVEELGNVTFSQESVEDVTLQYVDIESHKKSLAIEQERLFVLLENAEKLEDIIAIETRLSQVRYELEYYETQLRTYDNLIDYSKITIMIQEVERISLVENDTMWDKIQSGFLESIYNIADGLNNFVIWFLISIPYILLWGILIVIVTVLIRIILRRKKINRKSDQNNLEDNTKSIENEKKEEQ